MTQPSADFTKQLPASVRKQLLVARIAVERVEFIQAAEQFRERAQPGRLVRRALSSSLRGALNPASSLLGLLDFTRSHPYVGSILGSVVSMLLRRRLLGLLFGRFAKLGLAAGAVYGMAQLLRRERSH
ncbi:MAG: hypothetical protein RBR52_14590 [Thiomonas sp.]|uniref:hypothetical protein n=1 Tax=Thiomonas sp. TaxID=2047785 RepID=UPI002A3646D8|nr:hypothetical protein [Thiomonas sp.]MDY0331703.1 hypothetical protein [Thiomonas sp.]